MISTRILNDIEVTEFNQKYNTAYTIINIKKIYNRYLIIADCNIKFQMSGKEVANYFI